MDGRVNLFIFVLATGVIVFVPEFVVLVAGPRGAGLGVSLCWSQTRPGRLLGHHEALVCGSAASSPNLPIS